MASPVTQLPALTVNGTSAGRDAAATLDMSSLLQVGTAVGKPGFLEKFAEGKTLPIIGIVLGAVIVVGSALFLGYSAYEAYEAYKAGAPGEPKPDIGELLVENQFPVFVMGFGIVIIIASSYLLKNIDSLIQITSDSFIDDNTAAAWADCVISAAHGLSDSFREPSEQKLSALQRAAVSEAAASFGKYYKKVFHADEWQRIGNLDGSTLSEVQKFMHELVISQLNGTGQRTLVSQRKELSALLQASAREVVERLPGDHVHLALANLHIEHMADVLGKVGFAPSKLDGGSILDKRSFYKIGTRAGLIGKSFDGLASFSSRGKIE